MATNTMFSPAGGSRIIPLISFVNEAGFTALAGSAEQLIHTSVFVPGGLIEEGDKIQVVTFSADASTPDAQVRAVRLRAHTSDAPLSGVVLSQASTSSASTIYMNLDKPTLFGSTTYRVGAAGSPGGLISTAVHLTGSFDPTVDHWFAITVANASSANHLFYKALVTLEKAS